MSKQSEAKERQVYVDRLIPNTCSNCAHFNSELYKPYNREKNLRCTLGGFAVKKHGACVKHTGNT